MGNPVVHFEIISPQGAAARDFYAEQFGWAFNTDNPLNYGATDTQAGDSAIGGGVADAYPGTSDHYVTFYIGVADVSATLDSVVAAGGSVAMPVVELPGGAKMAQFLDPQGARVGLLQQ